MSIMTKVQLQTAIKSINTGRIGLQGNIQEALINCAFYAMRDANAASFEQLLTAVGNAMHIKSITMWAEVYAPVLVRDGKFKINATAMKLMRVTNESDFEPFEREMRKMNWYEIAGKQPVKSIFETSAYLKSVIAHLVKKGASSDVIDIIKGAEVIALVAKTKLEDAVNDPQVELAA